MKKIVHKPAAPLYAAAAVWVLYALLFPLYRVGHFVIVLAASAAVYGIARLFWRSRKPPSIRSWTRWYPRARELWRKCAA